MLSCFGSLPAVGRHGWMSWLCNCFWRHLFSGGWKSKNSILYPVGRSECFRRGGFECNWRQILSYDVLIVALSSALDLGFAAAKPMRQRADLKWTMWWCSGGRLHALLWRCRIQDESGCQPCGCCGLVHGRSLAYLSWHSGHQRQWTKSDSPVKQDHHYWQSGARYSADSGTTFASGPACQLYSTAAVCWSVVTICFTHH